MRANISASYRERWRWKNFTLCLTTAGGIGPPETVDYLDQVFNRAASREAAAGHSRRDAFHRRDCFYAALHAALIRATATMLCHHTADTPRHHAAASAAVTAAARSAAATAAAAAAVTAAAAALPPAASDPADAAHAAPATDPTDPDTDTATAE